MRRLQRREELRRLAVEEDRQTLPHAQRGRARVRRPRRQRRPLPFPFDEGKEYSIAKHANTYGASDGYNFTSPVGSFPPNAFGVYDMHGNVYEWVADCWHDHYNGAPSDGSAWMEDKCELVQIRGNDWGEPPIFSRSGNRNNAYPDARGDWIGFRVAREL